MDDDDDLNGIPQLKDVDSGKQSDYYYADLTWLLWIPLIALCCCCYCCYPEKKREPPKPEVYRLALVPV